MIQQQITLPGGFTIRDSFGDRYVIEGLLGKGRTGAVYLVRKQHASQPLFALKEVINPNKQDRERFLFEAELLKRLDHRTLPYIYQVFEHDKLKRVFILMDYIQGRNLESLRQELPERRFSLFLVLALMQPIVDALIYLHHQDPPIVHRDIKPENIIVPVGGSKTVLVDFGSAKEYVADRATTTIRHRSPGYAAPEQYERGTTPRTDIYGLGATIYTLLTGTVPPDAIMRITRSKGKGMHDPLKPANLLLPTIPADVAQALQHSMSISSADRFETVEEFWQLLNAHNTEHQVQLPSVTSADTPQPLLAQEMQRPISMKQRKILLSISLLLLLVIMVTGISRLPYFWAFNLLILLCLAILLLLVLLLLLQK